MKIPVFYKKIKKPVLDSLLIFSKMDIYKCPNFRFIELLFQPLFWKSDLKHNAVNPGFIYNIC